MTLSAITGSRFDATQQKAAVFDRTPSADHYADEDDFLICRGNGNRDLVGVGAFAVPTPGVTFPDTIIAARIQPERVTPEFLELAWRSDVVRQQVRAVARVGRPCRSWRSLRPSCSARCAKPATRLGGHYLPHVEDHGPVVLRAVLARARFLMSGDPVEAKLRDGNGTWYRIRAARTDAGDGTVAVVIEPASPPTCWR